ncbi:MAG: hypothetical protein Kow0077_15550 [Anaerolineae bacterium]
MTDYFLDSEQRFVIRNYQRKPAFASFLPGIAGVMGVPLWVFYVNRGQGIASFGIEGKDVPIVEFQPANKAYQLVSTTGFRTFIRRDSAPHEVYEPFGTCPTPHATPTRQMVIGMNDLQLVEESEPHRLRVDVSYFTLTEEPLAGLVRRVTITNTGQAAQTLEVVDGLPVIVPFGMTDGLMKNMARTAEAWMGVFSAAEHVPFYRLRSSISDTVEVESYEAGHYYLCFAGDGVPLPAVVDPVALFDENTAFTSPDRLVQGGLDAVLAHPQVRLGRTPCGFFGVRRTLAPGESLALNGIIGHAASIDLLQSHLDRMTRPAFIEDQARRARQLVEQLTDHVRIATGEPLLDAYTRQTFLDNVLRGGWPLILAGGERRFVHHIYSRKHGDLERDYNAFALAAEPYSQGNGNYRDVNQNRREDVWLNPAVEDYNVITFMNLLQADGYNPLVVRGNVYRVPESARAALRGLVKQPEQLDAALAGAFTPGSLLKRVAIGALALAVPPDEFLAQVLAHAEQYFEADFGEGYWIDHWTYNLDLIENFLSIYPDRQQELLFEKQVFTYYDSPEIVSPRSEKHVLVDGFVRQRAAVVPDAEKMALIASRESQPHVMRAAHGKGPIFRTTLIVKLVGLAAIKFATQDPAGMGIEMEANKPGWYDALNGLPGLFGSSLPETFELIRLARFIGDALRHAPVTDLELPEELVALLRALEAALDRYAQDQADDRDFIFWDAAATARERYCAATCLGFSGTLQPYPVAGLRALMDRFAAKLQAGVDRATAQNGGIPPTYLRFEAVDYERLPRVSEDGPQPVRVTAFKPLILPLFLEGPVRGLKIETDRSKALNLHQRVRESALYDRELGMYKVNAGLDAEPFDIGRARAFPPGWLENESIWLHMAYKYLLALLQAGLYEPFYAEVRQGLIPFQPPERYGRSPLENSSFIVSSAFPDENLHGRGFVARLSGSTAEYLSILHHLMFGPRPFRQTPDGLQLGFEPVLADWLFDDQGRLACTFLGQVGVTYVNPKRAATFGAGAVRPGHYTVTARSGAIIDVAGAVLPEPLAKQVRQGAVAHIEVVLE